MKFFITAIILMMSSSCFSQLIGWTFDQVVRLKGTEYEIKNSTRNDGTEIYFLRYNKELYIDGPKELTNYQETFVFKKAANIVYSYNFLGAKKETDLTSLIESNNQKFRIIDKGVKQKDFEWHDEKSNTVYMLGIMSDVGNEYKYVSYVAMGQE